MSLKNIEKEAEKPKISIDNRVLQGIKNHTLWPEWTRILIVDPGEYRASSSIGMMAALVEAGIEPTDFDHIIFASSGSFAGMWFVLWRMPEMVKYCKTHSPRETMRFRDIRSWSILKVEQLLSGILTGKQLHKADDWYVNPVLPQHFHAARPDGKKNPVIHVVTTTTGGHPEPRYIRSDEVSPEEFQKALTATLTIPRWSEPIRHIWDEALIDGYFSDPVMYDYARSLGGSHIVKLGNHNWPHLEPESSEMFVSYWLNKFPFLAKFYAKKRPHDIHHQVQRMYDDERAGKVQILFAEPYTDAFENPLLTWRNTGFNENILAGRQRMLELLHDQDAWLPLLRPVSPKTLSETLQDMIETLYNYHQIGK